MSREFIDLLIVLGALAASIGATVGIFNLIRRRYSLIVTVIDRKDSYDERGFIFIEFHIMNMSNRFVIINNFGLVYSDGNRLKRKEYIFLKPKESYTQTSGWQLWEDKEKRRYIKYAFAEDEKKQTYKGNIPKAIEYFAK